MTREQSEFMARALRVPTLAEALDLLCERAAMRLRRAGWPDDPVSREWQEAVRQRGGGPGKDTEAGTAAELLRQVHLVRGLIRDGDTEDAILEAFRLGLLVRQDTLAVRFRRLGAARTRAKAGDKDRPFFAAAARAWRADPEASRVLIATRAAKATKDKRSPDYLASKLPARERLVCVSEAGVERLLHAPDKDGRCVYCGESELIPGTF